MRIVLVYIIICIKEAFNFRFTIFRVGVAFGAGMLLIERSQKYRILWPLLPNAGRNISSRIKRWFSKPFPNTSPLFSYGCKSWVCAQFIWIKCQYWCQCRAAFDCTILRIVHQFSTQGNIVFFALSLSLSLSSILCRLFVVFYKFIVFSYVKRQARAHSRNTFHSTVHGVCWFWFVFRKSKMKRAACVCLFIRANDIRVHNAVGDRQWMIGCIKSSGSSQTVEPVQHSY